MMKLSIIIVNYKTLQLTKHTIQSVLKSNVSFAYEILLVDNASKDGSIEKLEETFPEEKERELLHILKNSENLGFSKANNQGIKRAKGEYILLLNSDTYLEETALERAIAYMEEQNQANKEQIGALGAKVVLPNGSLDHACKRGFPTPLASLYYLLKLDRINPKKFGLYDALHLGEDEIGEVDSLMGAFMLMPRKVLDEVGLLDEDFFMYGEDIDLCYRIKEAGYKIMYYPKAMITHYKGGSSTKRRTKVIKDFHEAMWIFYKKHYQEKYSVLVTCLVAGGIYMKYNMALLKNAWRPMKG